MHINVQLPSQIVGHVQIGQFELAFTEANHVSCQGNVTVRNVEYKTHLHLYRHPDASWKLQPHQPKPGNTYDPYIRRNDRIIGDHPSDAALKTILYGLPQALNNSIIALPNLDQIRQQAEVEHCEYEARGHREKVQELKKQLEAETKLLTAAQNRVNAALANELPTCW